MDHHLRQALAVIVAQELAAGDCDWLQREGLLGLAARFGSAAGLAPELVEQAQRINAAYVAQWMSWQPTWRRVTGSIPLALVLKGAALTSWLYPQPGDRPVGDLDLLIPRAERGAAHRALTALGFQTLPAVENELSMCQRAYRLDANLPCHVDLHWQSSNRPLLARTLTYETMQRSAATIEGLRVPGKTQAFLHAVVHLFGHHGHDVRWKWLLDLHLLWLQLSTAERAELARLALELELAPLADAALALLARRLATPFTEAARSRLLAGAEQPCRRLLQPGLVEWQDLQTLPGLRARLIYLSTLLLPDREYMQQRGLGGPPLNYVRRAYRGLRRRSSSR